jgi:hypothetical protein
MNFKHLVIVILLMPVTTNAHPAPWYQWRSKLNNHIVCAQTSPGHGWVLENGPYKDTRCQLFIKH